MKYWYEVNETVKIYNEEGFIMEIDNTELGEYAAILNCLIMAKQGDTIYSDNRNIINQITLNSSCPIEYKEFRKDCELLWKSKLVRIQKNVSKDL